MKKITFGPEETQSITQFNSIHASSSLLASGQGESRVHYVHFEENSEIGPHKAGFAQLFLVISGEGWAAGEDGVRTELNTGEGGIFEKGETHSKGSQIGMGVLMIQWEQLHVPA